MCEQHIVNSNVRLNRRVSFRTVKTKGRRASTRRCYSLVIPSKCKHVGFIYCSPMQHSISKLLEASICISCEVSPTRRLIYNQNQEKKGRWKRRINQKKKTYTISRLSQPPYSSSRTCGRSKWCNVACGWIPASVTKKKYIYGLVATNKQDFGIQS